MKVSSTTVRILLLLVLGAVSSVCAMPPHPTLLDRIRSGEIAAPYALTHAAEIRAAGVDAPSPARRVFGQDRHTLDENINLIALLVDFSDQPAQVGASFFDTLFFANRTGTVRHYYAEVSYGSLTLTTVNLPGTLGWLRAPQSYSYYVNSNNGFGAYPRNAQRLTEDAVSLADPFVDFSLYDNDNDGHVDGLFVIHSGPGAELTGNDNDIWSHAWSTSHPLNVDGVLITSYSMEPEYWQSPGDMTCGVYAHEMGHAVFGLPDLYDYGYDSRGLGSWSLMAGGSWNGRLGASPAHPDAWCRIWMGFVTPTVLTANQTGVAIPGVQSSPTIYRLWTNGTTGAQYFLVENRRRAGYDSQLPGAGLLIYHVDEMQTGNNNQWYPGHTSSGNYLVALEQADALWELEQDLSSGDNADPYPGSTNNRTFTHSSVPNSRSYSGQRTYVGVRNISSSADTMFADMTVRAGAGNSVYVQLPDMVAAPGDTVTVSVIVDSVTAHNITSFHLAMRCDSSVARLVAPYSLRVGTLVPQSWTVNQSHSLGTVVVDASGAAALTGEGALLRLVLRVQSDAMEGWISPLEIAELVFNQGEPPVDIVNGSLTVGGPHITSVPAQLDFGNVAVGENLSRVLIVRNTGTTVLAVNSVMALPPFTTDFTSPVMLAGNEWFRVRVTFTPDSARAYQDSLVIASNAIEGEIRVPLAGRGTASAVDEAESNAPPLRFGLAQLYPNPFNPSTTVTYELPQSGRISLRVFDLNGREVAQLAGGFMSAGRHHVNFDATHLPSGTYFVGLSSASQTDTRKILLIR